ncbi:MAG: UPF0182 family protein [Leptospirales bacterium]|nr:UPF0182 family protein [Leptospirales bacterium]
MKSRITWVILLTSIALLAVALSAFSSFFVDYLWFSSQLQADAWRRTLQQRLLFYGLGALMSWAAATAGFRIAAWRRKNYILLNRGPSGDAFFHLAAALLGLAVGGPFAQPQWKLWALALAAPESGVIDPVHGLDASVYMFHLPLYAQLLQDAAFLIVTAALFGAAAYLAPLRNLAGRWNWRSAERAMFFALPQLALSGALLLAVLALAALLARFTAVISGSADNISGASYLDAHARLPAYFLAAGLCAAGAVALAICGFLRSWRPPALSLAALAVLLFGTLQLYPGFVYFTEVYSSEAIAQAPFVRRSIEFTRRGFGVWAVRLGRLPSAGRFGAGALRSQLNLEAIPLWSKQEARNAFRQQQSWRSFYDFNDVDLIRYQIDGRPREMLSAARELNRARLPEGSRSWEARRLQFTHGYGMVMAPVAAAGAEGAPQYWMRDVPPSAARPGLPGLRRPAIYFGEADNEYAVVRTALPEADYPLEEGYAETAYDGMGGIEIGAGLRKFFIALQFDFWNLLFSEYIKKDSRILLNREIRGAVQKIAPFLVQDSDPYLVAADDGRLYWILDAYTVSSRYPYAAAVDGILSAALPSSEQRLRATFRGRNYVRNSVKAVIDAYDGRVRLYIFDRNDPHIRAWSRIYPEMFLPIKEMPASLRRRLRHPRDLFMLQAAVYATHHGEDVQAFLKGEDRWQFGTEVVQGVQQAMDARYGVVELPDESTPEYVISLPLISPARQTMVAWIAARCDFRDNPQANRFGEIVVYQALRSQAPPGPLQIESLIEQNPDISREMAEWNQQGDRVLRGRLSVLPVDDSILYVEPIFVQPPKGGSAELRRVVASDGNVLAAGDSLDAALLALAAASQQDASPPESPDADLRAVAARALTALKRAQTAAGAGDWVEYGRQMTELRTFLNRMVAQ